MTDDVTLLRPLPSSLIVAVHPKAEGDVVSVSWTDANGHRYLLATDPATAFQLAEDLNEATTDPQVAAEADRLRR